MKEETKEKLVGEGVGFERIRRITGYLVGTVDRFNNGKKAEERDKLEKSSLKTGVRHCVDKIPSYILRLLCVRA